MTTLLADRVTEKTVQKVMAELGATPGEVAIKLHALGWVGIPGEACDCPLARYLMAKLGCEVVIGIYELTVRTPAGSLEILMPHALVKFVHGFDHDRYPFLVRR